MSMSDPQIGATIIQNQIMEPKSAQGIYDLPCGYLDEEGTLHKEIKVREITGYEEDMLANPKMSGNKKINEIITGCVERVGTITDKGKLSQIVKDMLVGDRTFMFFAIRRTTVGDLYTYEDSCPDPECNAKSTFTVDLSSLDIREMENPMTREHKLTLPRSKKEVVIFPMTGRGEEKLQHLTKAHNDKDTLSLAILLRLKEIDGSKPDMDAVKRLGLKDRQYLRNSFEKLEGGVDTSTEMDCSSCGKPFKKELDVAQSSFFFPSEAQES